METWHIAKYATDKIKTANVISETPSFVMLESGRKEAKSSNYGTYHPTHESAKQDILLRLYTEKQRLFESIASIERRIEEAAKL
jgi:hypothetical protein